MDNVFKVGDIVEIMPKDEVDTKPFEQLMHVFNNDYSYYELGSLIGKEFQIIKIGKWEDGIFFAQTDPKFPMHEPFLQYLKKFNEFENELI